MLTIDLNVDLGEGYPFDEQLMPWISSVNIACGYHAGDLATMTRVSGMAQRLGLAIGAHVGFADRVHFGRLALPLSDSEIYELVVEQIRILQGVLAAQGYSLQHVKPHGALYNIAASNSSTARCVAQAVYDMDPGLKLLGLSGSQLIAQGRSVGLVTVSEVFADRSYQDDASLTPRSVPGALIEDPLESVNQILNMIRHGWTRSLSGKQVQVRAQTVCIHGESPQAPHLAKVIYEALVKEGVRIERP
jgi:UPF0271 protein